MQIHVVGAGLIGGSIALAAAHNGHDVSVADLSSEKTEYAAGVLGLKTDFLSPDVVFIAVPPQAVAACIADLNRINPNATFIDVSSVKTEVVLDVESVCGRLENFIPSHPMAGKETSGPESASFDLFQNRIWVLTPTDYSNVSRVAEIKTLLETFGALVVELSMKDHDQLVALTSHTPQVLASALASLTVEIGEVELAVSGNGLRDMTRLAGSNPDLWSEILISNRKNVSIALQKIIAELSELDKQLNLDNRLAVKQFIDKGNLAKSRLPGKHGEKAEKFDLIAIQIDDRPGALAEIFNLAKQQNINIEDVRIDHALGRQIAVIELSVLPSVSADFRTALKADGWMIRFDSE